MDSFWNSLSTTAGVVISILLTGLLSYAVYLRSKREDYDTSILNRKQELNKLVNVILQQFLANGIKPMPYDDHKMEALIISFPDWAKSSTEARRVLCEIIAMTPLPSHSPGRSTQKIFDTRSMSDKNFLEWANQFTNFVSSLHSLWIALPVQKQLTRIPLGGIPYFTIEWFSDKCLKAAEHTHDILWLKKIKATYEWGHRVRHRKKLYIWFTAIAITGVLIPWIAMLTIPECVGLALFSLGGFILSLGGTIRSLLTALKEA